jgi:hypothetical protein
MRGSRRAIVAAVALLTASAGAEAAAANKQGDRRAQCAVRGSAARLDVRCPAVPLADLLGALHRATGLRSTYPSELAGARVSVTTRSAALADVLKSALAEFNFATWVDESSPNITQLSIVGLRRAVDGVEPSLAPEPAASPAREQQPSASRQSDRKPAQATETPAVPTGSSPPQWVVAGAAATPSTPVQTQQRVLAPTPAPVLEVGAPSAYLLSPPTAGRTPVLPQRSSETPVLKPGIPAESAPN